jgi:hypothetical protein
MPFVLLVLTFTVLSIVFYTAPQSTCWLPPSSATLPHGNRLLDSLFSQNSLPFLNFTLSAHLSRFTSILSWCPFLTSITLSFSYIYPSVFFSYRSFCLFLTSIPLSFSHIHNSIFFSHISLCIFLSSIPLSFSHTYPTVFFSLLSLYFSLTYSIPLYSLTFILHYPVSSFFVITMFQVFLHL